MPLTALALVLLSALLHASWNLAFKRSGGGRAFMLAYSVAAVVLYAPVAFVAWRMLPPGARALTPQQWLFALGSGVIHFGYFVLLDKAYRVGDLSVVYPVARSTGPLLTVGGAMLLFAERPTAVALAGAALIAAGAFFIAGGRSADAHKPRGVSVMFALATGLFIAVYTMWDRYAVRNLGLPVVLLDWLSGTFRLALMLPLFWRWRSDARTAARTQWRAIGFIAAVSPLSYMLVLYAMTLAPLAYVAPARESSVIFGALFGTLLLREGQVARRVGCAAVMCAGLALLATH